MQNVDDTLDEEHILMIFDYLEVQNSPLWISFSRRPQNLIANERPTTSFPPALHVKDYYTCIKRGCAKDWCLTIRC